MAVAGLPQPRSDHAVAMVRFAVDCHATMRKLVHQLETTLGPDTGELTTMTTATAPGDDVSLLNRLLGSFVFSFLRLTGDLDMRIGLHSGPATAGVLRGDRARFQLFGDTMNTASRMESTSLKGKIQISSNTAQLLTNAGKVRSSR